MWLLLANRFVAETNLPGFALPINCLFLNCQVASNYYIQIKKGAIRVLNLTPDALKTMAKPPHPAKLPADDLYVYRNDGAFVK